MDVIESYDDAILITNVSYKKIYEEDEEKPEEEMTFEELNIAEDDEVEVSMSIALYSVYDLKKPGYDKAE